MTPLAPHLVRALYQWLLDNHRTPYFLIDCSQPGVDVPTHVITNNMTSLNVSPKVAQSLSMANDEVVAELSFDGKIGVVRFPMTAILTVYSGEDQIGMSIPQVPMVDRPPVPATAVKEKPAVSGDALQTKQIPWSKRGHLRIVK